MPKQRESFRDEEEYMEYLQDSRDLVQEQIDLESEMAMIVHDPENTKKLTKLWAIISRDEDGNEGIVGSEIGQWITGSETNKAKFIAMAKQAFILTKKKLWLVEYVPNGEATEL